MTVKRLIRILEGYDEDTKVFIGIRQSFGSDFVYSINDFEDGLRVNMFYGHDVKNALCILEGDQIGVMCDDEDFDDEDCDDSEE